MQPIIEAIESSGIMRNDKCISEMTKEMRMKQVAYKVI
jgi:hypothetical protein